MPSHLSRLGLAALLACAGSVAGAGAQEKAAEPKAVVELFTSQGCSSCPPADAVIAELARDPAVVALTLPVTYWDYLGWKDTLGQDSFTKRQKLYSKARGDGQVYTPQAVINGAAHVVGSDRGAIDGAIAQNAAGGFPVRLALERKGATLSVAIEARPEAAGQRGQLWLLPVKRLVSVPIGRGENQGKTVSYANVVRGMVRLGAWDGTAARIEAPLPASPAGDADSYVVLLQAESAGRYGVLPGAILGAARAPL